METNEKLIWFGELRLAVGCFYIGRQIKKVLGFKL